MAVARTILIRDRDFVGTDIVAAGCKRSCLVGTKEIEFYDETGRMLKSGGLEQTEKQASRLRPIKD